MRIILFYFFFFSLIMIFETFLNFDSSHVFYIIEIHIIIIIIILTKIKGGKIVRARVGNSECMCVDT